MKYRNITPAKFISRRNRFVAQVEISGRTETVHVKNTGRCKELLLPNSDVILDTQNSKKRFALLWQRIKADTVTAE